MDQQHVIGRTEKVRMLKELLAENRIVYISSYFYTGKTLLMEQLAAQWPGEVKHLDFTAGDFQDAFAGQGSASSPCLLLIDQLHLLPEGPAADRLFACLSALSPGLCVLLAGRAQLPAPLRSLCASGAALVLDRDFTAFTAEEMNQLYLTYGLALKPRDLEYLREASWGWAYAQHVVAQKMLKNPGMTVHAVWETVFADLQQILMTDVVHGLPEEEQSFLYRLSPFAEFTEEMASVISGRKDAPKLLSGILEKSHLLFSEKQGEYRFIPFVRQALYRELVCGYSDDYIRNLYRRAALYCELQNQIPQAVAIYRELNDREKIRELLIRESRHRPANGDYVALQEAYALLDLEDILNSPELMKSMCLIESMKGRAAESDRWLEELKHFAARTPEKDSRQRAAQEIIAYLEILLPHRGSRHTLEVLLATARLNRWTGSSSWRGGFNVAGNSVSLMNGGKDFSRWVPHGPMIYRLARNQIEAALGRGGSGLSDLAIGECFLETGEDDRYEEAYQHVYAGLSRVRDDLELRCAGTGIQSRILAAQGSAGEAEQVILHLIESLPGNAPVRLRQNLEIHRLWLRLLRGEPSEALAWLETSAPDETREFVTLDRYGYLLKLRLYIMTARWKETRMLCAMLRQYFESYDRPYMLTQLRLLQAVICRRSGQGDWEAEMRAALDTARRYGLVRVIADEGIAVIDMLHELRLPEQKWEQTVLRQTRAQAARYPAYMKENAERPLLSEREYQVYSLMLAGFSNAKIASILGITERTVKYHTGAIYEKLGVRTRAEAISRAAELGDL